MVASPLPCQGPKRGQNCYVTLACVGVPNTKHRGGNQKGLPHPFLLGAQNRAKLLRNPYMLGGPQCQAWGENQKWLPQPCLVGGPKGGRNCYATPAFSGPPNTKRGEGTPKIPNAM